MKSFWTCWVDGTTGGYGYRHPTFGSAQAEADRLSRMPGNKGKRVVVLQSIGYAEIPIPETWHLCETNDIPF